MSCRCLLGCNTTECFVHKSISTIHEFWDCFIILNHWLVLLMFYWASLAHYWITTKIIPLNSKSLCCFFNSRFRQYIHIPKIRRSSVWSRSRCFESSNIFGSFSISKSRWFNTVIAWIYLVTSMKLSILIMLAWTRVEVFW